MPPAACVERSYPDQSEVWRMATLRQRYSLSLCVAVALLAGCGGASTTPAAAGYSTAPLQLGGVTPPLPKTPILIAFVVTKVFKQGTLMYWPIRAGGGSKPERLSRALGVKYVSGLAANGDIIVLANNGSNSKTAGVVKYNVVTKHEKTMRDPYGQPGDVAVDKQGNIYALGGYGTITVYSKGSSKPSLLSCPLMYDSVTLAVDNEGDVFAAGQVLKGKGSKVFEFPAGSQNCTVLHLRVDQVVAIGIDPKTDDLIVLDGAHVQSGQVAMLIYPRPYSPRTVIRHALTVTTGTSVFRLDANSTRIFYSDSVSVGSESKPVIDQAQYPSGKFEAYYENSAARAFGGFTTIPNTLPN
jgi:hypothetical protein